MTSGRGGGGGGGSFHFPVFVYLIKYVMHDKYHCHVQMWLPAPDYGVSFQTESEETLNVFTEQCENSFFYFFID